MHAWTKPQPYGPNTNMNHPQAQEYIIFFLYLFSRKGKHLVVFRAQESHITLHFFNCPYIFVFVLLYIGCASNADRVASGRRVVPLERKGGRRGAGQARSAGAAHGARAGELGARGGQSVARRACHHRRACRRGLAFLSEPRRQVRPGPAHCIPRVTFFLLTHIN